MSKRVVKYKDKKYVYENDDMVLITREIPKEVADACKKLHEESRPKIPLNFMCEEGLKMFLRSKDIDI